MGGRSPTPAPAARCRAKLAAAVVAIVGVSGGGSHVFQQLTHQGVGTLNPIDDQIRDETNLGRHVGAHAADIDRTFKTAIAKRLAAGVDPSILVSEVNERFPSSRTIAALKGADIVVSCLDRFDAREAINAFCRRYLIPLVDIGMSITSTGERLAKADGQVIVSLPGEPCLRCYFLTDAILEWERRERPPGYDQNPDAAGDPQVVSMNGVLASEACNCVLDLITGYSGGERGARQWQLRGAQRTVGADGLAFTATRLSRLRPGRPWRRAVCAGLREPAARTGTSPTVRSPEAQLRPNRPACHRCAIQR